MEDRPKFQTRADRILLNAKAINRVRHDEQENRRSGRVRTASRRLVDDFVTTLPTKMTVTLFAAVVILMLSSRVYSYQYLQQYIPNGAMVPNPCDSSTNWNGVGHQNPMGGGPRNIFGLEFKANNLTWNKTICEKDSDGDGYSNGQELGDPNCTWSPGQTPSRTMNLTHPGICEPLGSTMCATRNAWLKNCNISKFDCPAINDSGVKNYTMRYPPTPVPTDETTYICNLFRLPNDSDTDIIAIEPVIDNTEIVHHMLLFACTGDVTGIPSNGPFFCGMNGGLQCRTLIGMWIFGSVGQCFDSQYGIRIGPTGYQYAVLQMHWNNPMHKANLTDSSGMRISHTTKLRPNRGAIMFVGPRDMEIPPGKDNVTLSGSCTGWCTREKLNQSKYITSSTMHMHLIGKAATVRLFRNGQLLQVIEEVASYDYNRPTMTEFKTPIEIKPGDSIEVNCTYDSTHRNTTTYYGQATSAEMCIAFLAYYPEVQYFGACGQYKSVHVCGSMALLKSDRCDLTTFMNNAGQLPTLCSANCSNSNCRKALDAALMTGCQRDEDVLSALQVFFPTVLPSLEYCALLQPPPNTVCTSPRAIEVPSHCSLMKSYSGPIPLLAFVVYARYLF